MAETAVFIVPLRAGGGMRMKILDTWCWGLPIVSTEIGAEGIQVRADENILLADDADHFTEAVLRLVEDPSLNRPLREYGRRWVEEKYDWRRSTPPGTKSILGLSKSMTSKTRRYLLLILLVSVALRVLVRLIPRQ